MIERVEERCVEEHDQDRAGQADHDPHEQRRVRLHPRWPPGALVCDGIAEGMIPVCVLGADILEGQHEALARMTHKPCDSLDVRPCRAPPDAARLPTARPEVDGAVTRLRRDDRLCHVHGNRVLMRHLLRLHRHGRHGRGHVNERRRHCR